MTTQRQRTTLCIMHGLVRTEIENRILKLHSGSWDSGEHGQA